MSAASSNALTCVAILRALARLGHSMLPKADTSAYAAAAATSPVVMVRGMPWTVDMRDLEAFFRPLAFRASNVHFLEDPSGRKTGEAYIEFNTIDDASEALARSNQLMDKRYVEVFPSSIKEMRSAATGGRASAAPPPPQQKSDCVIRMRGLPFGCVLCACICLWCVLCACNCVVVRAVRVYVYLFVVPAACAHSRLHLFVVRA
jgi:hypothetical protein